MYMCKYIYIHIYAMNLQYVYIYIDMCVRANHDEHTKSRTEMVVEYLKLCASINESPEPK